MAIRKAKLIVALGTNGTGKTTFIRSLVDAYLANGWNVLVATPDYNEWTDIQEIESTESRSPRGTSVYTYNPHDFKYTGARRLVLFDPKMTVKALDYINKYVRNTLIILDDCRSYIESRTDIDLKRLYVRRRQAMNDIVMAGHGFTEVPPRVFTFCSELVLFKTIDNIDTAKKYIQNFDAMKAAQQKINRIAATKPYYFEIIPQ